MCFQVNNLYRLPRTYLTNITYNTKMLIWNNLKSNMEVIISAELRTASG